MLPQTRQARHDLLKAGLKRKQFRVRTPWNRKVQGYGCTQIVLLSPYCQVAPCIPNLAKYFRTVITTREDATPFHVSVETDGKPGLYRYEEGGYIPMEPADKFIQLPLWSAE